MGVRVNDRVLIEHVPIRIVSCQALEVGDLVFNLRLDLAQALCEFLIRQAPRVSTPVVKPSLSLVLRDYMVPEALAASVCLPVVPIRVLSECGRMMLLSRAFALVSSLSNTLGWLSLHFLCSHRQVTLSSKFLLTREARLSRGAATTRAWWAEVHDYCYGHFISHLITAPSKATAFLLRRWQRMLAPRVASPSADAGAVFDWRGRPGLLRMVVAELETSPIVVYSTLVAVNLLLRRWALVRHGNVVLSSDTGTDWRNVGHVGVVVRAVHLGN